MLISRHYSRFFYSYKRPIVMESIRSDYEGAAKRIAQATPGRATTRLEIGHLYWSFWLAIGKINDEPQSSRQGNANNDGTPGQRLQV